jgi:hypothetical protein
MVVFKSRKGKVGNGTLKKLTFTVSEEESIITAITGKKHHISGYQVDSVSKSKLRGNNN